MSDATGVMRYDLEQPDSHMGMASMQEEPDCGDWVRYDDYAALSARLEAVEAERAELEGANIVNRTAIRLQKAKREAAESKLAQAVEALRGISTIGVAWSDRFEDQAIEARNIATATLAALDA
jgi:glycerol-3-phosphate dehydrogenase